MSKSEKELENLDALKKRLEINKLERENNRISLIYDYILKALPACLGIATIIYVASTGILNNQSILNELKAEKVQNQISKFEETRDSLFKVNNNLELENGKLISDSKRLSVEIENNKSLIETLTRNRNKNESERNRLLLNEILDQKIKFKDSLSRLQTDLDIYKNRLAKKMEEYDRDISNWKNEAQLWKTKFNEIQKFSHGF